MWSKTSPLEPGVRDLWQVSGILGLVWVVATTVLGSGLRKATCRALGVLVAMSLMRLFGPDISGWLSFATRNSVDVIPPLAAVAVLAAVEALFGSRGRRPLAVPRTAFAYRQTEADLWRVAVHEAGHAITYRLLPRYPEDMHVFVRPVITVDAPEGGAVRFTAMQVPQVHAYTAMLISLAGLEAEQAILGSRGNGGTQDYEEWIAAATGYAIEGHADAFYRYPVTYWQRQVNRDTIDSLKTRQRADLKAFLESNRGLLIEMAQKLVAHGSLNHPQLIAYLERVEVGSLNLPDRF